MTALSRWKIEVVLLVAGFTEKPYCPERLLMLNAVTSQTCYYSCIQLAIAMECGLALLAALSHHRK